VEAPLLFAQGNITNGAAGQIKADGLGSIVTVRSTRPIAPANPREFLRLKVTLSAP